jgi:glucose-1-phosphate cytidylyltransferase
VKVVILAGGLGTRLVEETQVRPKPMVEIVEHPILWHIMKHYSYFGFSEFIIALGYKGEFIKRYFLDYYELNCNIRVSLKHGKAEILNSAGEDWTVNLIDTGLMTNTGGRIKRLEPWLQDEAFMVTYGDGVSNVNLQHVLDFHRRNGRIATLTAVRPPARFGSLEIGDSLVTEFKEKSQTREGWINGGYFVFEPAIFDYIPGDETVLESHVLERLAREGQLAAYCHEEFWQCMDTLRDKRQLEDLWQQGNAPWKVWP